jgi:glutamine synthetase
MRRAVKVEYVWIGGDYELRSKIRMLYYNQTSDFFPIIPQWNYDGSSTNQLSTKNSEANIIPRAIFHHKENESNPLYDHLIVMCDTYDADNQPLKTNARQRANEIFSNNLSAEPWFGLEQEYFLFKTNSITPLGVDETSEGRGQGQYYCSAGSENAFGRDIAESHLDECLKWGINLSGINAEVAPGQWEYQVGPCTGIDAGDHLWIARYLLLKVGEKYNVRVSISPKPVKGIWNGSGCHTNFSTKEMREGTTRKNGLVYINEAIEKLSLVHNEHMEVYGQGNEERMTGECETARYDTFTHGAANRSASIRISNDVIKDGKGYFEDRRPSSNCDPYLVTSKIFETTTL